ncbi:hypothetical protein EfmAA818_11860 [Enterococcus faecium]|nr:hypothetical protein EfmAA818_11860 [Enterococcus faecium]
MNRSFFHYLMTLRGGGTHDALSVFATEAGKDIQFPKHSSSYEEISNYLELNVDYLPSMDIFDEAWEKYLENNHLFVDRCDDLGFAYSAGKNNQRGCTICVDCCCKYHC